MNKKTKLALGALGVVAVGYYLYKRMNPSVSPALATKSYSGEVGDRMGADGLLTRMRKAAQPYLPQVYRPENATALQKKKGFADGGYVSKGNLYNNNRRYGMTGQQTFFTSQSEKLNY
jgi:hypothetical protein